MKKIMDFDTVSQIYGEIKNIFFRERNNLSFTYEKEQHLVKRDVPDEIKNRYYDERGIVSFENQRGDTITIEIERWHLYKRWSKYGLYMFPHFKANVYKEKQLVWELKCYFHETFNGNYYETEATGLEIPEDILRPKLEVCVEGDLDGEERGSLDLNSGDVKRLVLR